MRAARTADADAMAALYRPYVEDTAVSFEDVPPDGAEMLRRMLAPPRRPWLVAERDGVVVGYAYASEHRARPAYRWAADCSVYLAASERRRGTGRALYERLLGHLRDLGYVTVSAGVTLPNDASAGFHEAMGFRPVGVYRDVGHKHGAWHDVGWWQLALRDPPPDPPPPLPWTGGRQ